MRSSGSVLIEGSPVDASTPVRDSQVAAAGSLERVEELRRQLAEHDATCARQREAVAAELTRQEAIWSAREAERIREERLSAVQVEFESARTAHVDSNAAADAAIEELRGVTSRAAVAFKAAVRAERACRDTAPALQAAWVRLHELDASTPAPDTGCTHSLAFGPQDPRSGTMLAGLITYPGTKRELAQLDLPSAGSSVTPAPELDALFARSDAKRRRDDGPLPAADVPGAGRQGCRTDSGAAALMPAG